MTSKSVTVGGHEFDSLRQAREALAFDVEQRAILLARIAELRGVVEAMDARIAAMSADPQIAV